MKNTSVRNLTFSAVLAALYAGLTLFLPIPQYGPVQIRFSEVLTVLPFFFPAATPGLFVGCIIANLFSPYILDVFFGSAATLLACLWTGRLNNRWLAPLPPVVCNAVIVGVEIAFSQAGSGPAFWPAFVGNALSVGLGELAACGILGTLLLSVLYRSSACRSMVDPARLARIYGFSDLI